ncbi:RNA polymerase II C-terminal domain phosphatase-like 2 isoform X2 [Impatiens glandulifera]|uniref:RNA polymerase II C-terminal domain phosphatase-like 2 isoform X2 n=1 Tax=Impatiens glandulifera TaxID=253017 RepID=UPI001FB06A14|nr:RNA polymerase II C-terminal domain phosphatase-like 2 isoform X2 [Impatiens glandulifera]
MTAVVVLGEEEIHLVAMPSKQKKFPCFWCFAVPSGLYNSCVWMLNLRCLSIVFDLDETLIVANTMKSFEDRIEALRNWLLRETDPIRVSGMTAELKRYMDDRILLKQYAEKDCVEDNGKMYTAQLEEVPPVSNGNERVVVRPIIRIPEKNTVLTRINPENRDTSVLVRLRPAWEDLRSYLTAKGRKRFEVYVCTMAERDYALEMWRLLDPEAHLIHSKQLLRRVVCVKSGARKSLLNVFQDGNCHPKMAMVIDDRLKVWEDKDQPRVHVVPPYTPYYAPQAEMANAVSVLCVARNVACNVRGGFFRDFDEILLRRISDLFYEDEVISLPSAPDVSNYMMSEDASFVPNGNIHVPIPEGMYVPEVVHQSNELDEKSTVRLVHPIVNGPESKPEASSHISATTVPGVRVPGSFRTIIPSDKPSLLGAPFRRDVGLSESEPEMKKRPFIVNPSQELRYQGLNEPPILSKLPGHGVLNNIQPQGGWLEDDNHRGYLNARTSGAILENTLNMEKQHLPQNHGASSHFSAGILQNLSEAKHEEACIGRGARKHNLPSLNQPSEVGVIHNLSSSNGGELTEGEKPNMVQSSLCMGVLQEIGRRCNSKVEFGPTTSNNKDMQFCVEVFFTGEKIGVGMGRTRKDAQQQAAENALRSLADKYLSHVTQQGSVDNNFDKLSISSENGFIWDTTSSGSGQTIDDALAKEECAEGRTVESSMSIEVSQVAAGKRARTSGYLVPPTQGGNNQKKR